MTTKQQNADGSWSPATPVPVIGVGPRIEFWLRARLANRRESVSLRHTLREVERVVNAIDDEHYAEMDGDFKYCNEGTCRTCGHLTRLNAALSA